VRKKERKKFSLAIVFMEVKSMPTIAGDVKARNEVKGRIA